MTPVEELKALKERVEAATGADRALDALFAVQVAGVETRPEPDGAVSLVAPAFTASIDAALALVERCLPHSVWTIEADACWLRFMGAEDVVETQGNKCGMGGEWTPLAIQSALLGALIARAEAAR